MNAARPVSLTVIIPALNEAPGIAATVRTTLSVFPGTRVIVVDGGSFDDTAEVAARAGAEVIASARGRGLQLAAGARLAATDWLLFLHADTILPQDAARLVGDFVRRPHARIATFRLRFDRAGWFLRWCCWFTRFDSVFTRFGDQGILVRRDFYDALGGFPAWPLFEDVALLQRARRLARIESLPAAVTTSARRFNRRGHLSQQWLNARLLARYLMGTPPERLAEIYRSPAKPTRAAAEPAVPTLYEAKRSKR